MLGHDYSVVQETVPVTCTQNGYTTYKCVRCDKTEIRNRATALGHNFSVLVETVPPTESEKGYDLYKCSRCEETEQRNFTNPTVNRVLNVKTIPSDDKITVSCGSGKRLSPNYRQSCRC